MLRSRRRRENGSQEASSWVLPGEGRLGITAVGIEVMISASDHASPCLLACLPACALQTIGDLDEKKREALEKTWRKVGGWMDGWMDGPRKLSLLNRGWAVWGVGRNW